MRSFDCPFHFHPEFEITHIVASEGTRIIGDHVGQFEAGDLVMLGGNLPHIYMNSAKHTSGKKRAHSQVIQFRDDCLGPDFFELPEMSNVRVLMDRSTRGLFFGPDTLGLARPLLDALVHDESGRRITHLLELLHVLAGTDASPLASTGYLPNIAHRDSERLDRICGFVNERFHDTIDQQEVAALVGMSASTFSRYFRKRTSMSFSRFVNEVRISHACKRLVETDDTVLAISQDCGFGNLSNFNRRFRDLRGLSPREFRNALRHK